MLNEKYKNTIEELEKLHLNLKKLLESEPDSNFEDEKAYSLLTALNENVEDTTKSLIHLTRNVKEGVLLLNSQGRYNLDSMPNTYFTCGDSLELYIDGHWHSGILEHDDNNYHLFNHEESWNAPLKEGLKARIRVDKIIQN